MHHVGLLLVTCLVMLKKGKARRNKSEIHGSHIEVLRDLKQFTDHTLPSVRERKELGLEINTGTSISQDIHYDKYVKIKFGIKDLQKEEMIRRQKNLKYLRRKYRSLNYTMNSSRNDFAIPYEQSSMSSSDDNPPDYPAIKLTTSESVLDTEKNENQRNQNVTLDCVNSTQALQLPVVPTKLLLAYENVGISLSSLFLDEWPKILKSEPQSHCCR